MCKYFSVKGWSDLCEAWAKAMYVEGCLKLQQGYSYSDVLDDLPDMLDWAGIDYYEVVDCPKWQAVEIGSMWIEKLYDKLRRYSDELDDEE